MKNKFLKNLYALLLCAAVIVSIPLQARAIDVPKLDKKGKVTIHFRYKGMNIPGGLVEIYKVADVDNTDENYTFVKTAEFADYTGDIYNWNDPDEIAAMEKFIRDRELKGRNEVNGEGGTIIRDVEVGLYFIVQTIPADGFSLANSFFVSMPAKVGDTYVYDVDATPKTEIEQTTTPPPPGIPDTGVAEWKVPAFAISGVLIFAMGWYLFRKGAQNG